MDVVATGVPAWPEIDGGFDLSPLLMILAAFVVAPLLFRVRLTPIAAILLVAGGTLAAWLADWIGLLPALAAGTLALAAGASIARRRRPHRG
jgi:CHASE2 domain-containing sensor protein